MEPGRAGWLKSALVGVRLPAQRDELLEHAVRRRAEPQLLEGLRSLDPEAQYDSLDTVVEKLLQVHGRLGERHAPREETTVSPGGED